MNSYLLFLLKSTLCLSLLYLAFGMLMRKETAFKLNRMVLLFMVLSSLLIPFLQSPQLAQSIVQDKLEPIFQTSTILEEPIQSNDLPTTIQLSAPASETNQPVILSGPAILLFVYLLGVFVSFLILVYSISSVLLLFRKARKVDQDGIRLMIVADDVPAFSFGRQILISQHDYDTNSEAIIIHEKSHIRMGHFYDLMLMELVKIIFWFNPLVYRLIHDLKEIHEFQADQYTLNKGIDATQYQILIIQKSVGSQRFALANSFNHCQIKKRITMMNKQKTSKARRWKVATFLPLLALLLMAFGRTGENVLPNPETSSTVFQVSQEPEKQWTEADFGKVVYNKEAQPRGFMAFSIRLNSKSQLVVNGKFDDWEEATKQIRKCLDYDFASDDMKQTFEKITINGQERMAQKYTILNIMRDVSTPAEKYQNLLNSVGKVVMETRQKYANEIYKTSYQKLTQAQRDEIIKLIPAIARFDQYPILAPETQANKPSLYIEVRAEGIFVLPDKNVVTIDEMEQKAEIFAKENGRFVDVRTAAGLKDEQVSKVKEALKDIKLSIRYLTFDPVYVMVEQMAEFPGGNTGLKEWLSKNITYPETAKANGLEGKVYISLVINSKGKAVFPKVARGLSPELDAEALKLVTQMPEWKPAIQNGVPVSVSYTMPINFSMK